MSIPYIILLSELIFHWFGMMTAVHLAALDWQTKQIAVDNAATVMGQKDRALFNQIIRYNKVIRGLEVPHHVAHECRNSPLPWVSASCEAADIGFETTIRSMHQFMMATAKIQWLASTAKGLSELGKLKTKPETWERPRTVPVHAETCEICGLDTYIEIDEAPVKTFIQAKSQVPIGVMSEVGGKSLKRDSKWNYKLNTGEEKLKMTKMAGF